MRSWNLNSILWNFQFVKSKKLKFKTLWNFEILETFRKKLKFKTLWVLEIRNSNSKFLKFQNSRFCKIFKIVETLKNSNSRFSEISKFSNSRSSKYLNIFIQCTNDKFIDD